jgi:Type II restriction enzyme SfiI
MSIDPGSLANDTEIIERIEKASARLVCQAILDFASVARDQFKLAKDLAGTVGEDVTRDAMESMGLSRVPTARLIGKIDYKRAAYYFAPEYWIRQALFVD